MSANTIRTRGNCMEMDERKTKILTAIIRNYLEKELF